MSITFKRSNRKFTGGLLHKQRKKKKRDFGSDFIPVKLGEEKKKTMVGLSNFTKQRLLQANFINVTDPKTGKTKKTKIIGVIEHMDNINYTRMNIVTKGCVVKTESGNAKVTSRPGQDGLVNGILVEAKK
jgi:small subunit ribosomal protein S8e